MHVAHQVGLALFVMFGTWACVWLPFEAYGVIQNATTAIQCSAENYAQIGTEQLITELQGTCRRSADMLTNGVVRTQPNGPEYPL